MDRVVHHAIHRIIEPIIDPEIPNSVFACRKGKGNRNAALALLEILRKLEEKRFTVKLDVKKYFASISHIVLMEKIKNTLPDDSLTNLLWNLLKSPPEYAAKGFGIPVGNLTSQLFANFYLASADKLALENLNTGYYFRYMDDSVLIGKNKKEILEVAHLVIEHSEKDLKLEIPYYKRMPLGNAPVPFLGYLLHHTGYRALSRNKRRFGKKVRSLIRKNKRPSLISQVLQSYNAWSKLEEKKTNEITCCC